MAEQVRTGINFHDGQRDTSREVLQRVADAIRLAATRRSTELVLDYGLPAKTLPDAIGRLDALQKLTLMHTGLQSLPDTLGQLRQLRHLQVLGTPGLKKLPPSFTRLSNLQTLQLTFAPLDELPADLGRMQGLRNLTLAGGHYARLPASIVELSGLTELSMSRSSHFHELPENIGLMRGSGHWRWHRIPSLSGFLATSPSCIGWKNSTCLPIAGWRTCLRTSVNCAA